ELVVEWLGPPDDVARVIAQVDGGDRDELRLRPYAPPVPTDATAAVSLQRHALLLGAPDRAGSFAVSLDVIRQDSRTRVDHAFTIEVSADPAAAERAADAIAKASPGQPERVMRRTAWLREQLVPRLGQTAFHA